MPSKHHTTADRLLTRKFWDDRFHAEVIDLRKKDGRRSLDSVLNEAALRADRAAEIRSRHGQT